MPHPHDAAQLDTSASSDEAWLALAQFIRQLPGLTDLV